MSATIVACFLVGLATSETREWPPGIAGNNPPKPDFRVSFDYLQWMRDQGRFADSENSWQDYRDFVQVNPPPAMAPEARWQLDRLLRSPRPWGGEYAELDAWLESVERQLQSYTAGTRSKFFAEPISVTA